MKKIIKIVSVFTLLAFTACNVDNDKLIVASKDAANIVSPDQGSSIILNPDNQTNPALTVVWNHAKYTQATQVKYVIELAKSGANFANSKSVVVPDGQRQISWNVKQLNDLARDLTLVPFSVSDVDIRIKSSLGVDNSLQSISEKITVSIKSFSTDLSKLGVPGNHQGWAPTNAATLPLLAASEYGKTNFEGYVSLNGGFKFLTERPDGTFNWGNGFEWADDGSFSGVLVGTGGSNCNATAGYYLVKANTGVTTGTNPGGLSYSTTPITRWDITGSATPIGWPDATANGNNSTPMTYNATTKKWSITIALTGGKEIKFRANNGWDINLGKFDASKTGNDYGGKNMSYGGGNIPITTSGSYTVTLDVSSPRDYKYTVVLN
jgi:starch-binding outer membrane protein SusE/F